MLKSNPLLRNQKGLISNLNPKQYKHKETTPEDIKSLSEKMRYIQYIILGGIILFLVFIVILILFLIKNYFHK